MALPLLTDAVPSITTNTTGLVFLSAAVLVGNLVFFLNRSAGVKREAGDGAPPPPRVPHAIPFLGSAIEFGRNTYAFIKRHSQKFDDAPIVTAYVGGKTMHLIADPAAVVAMFRYGPKHLSMSPAISDFAGSFFGMSRGGRSIIESRETVGLLGKHMLHRDGLQKSLASVQEAIGVHLGALTNGSDGDLAQKGELDLYRLINGVMLRATLDSVISKSLSNDDFAPIYRTFEDAMLIAFAGLPMRYFAPSSQAAREKLVSMLQDGSSPLSDFLVERDEHMKSAGMTRDDIARNNLFWTWAAVTNFIPSTFWLVYFVSSNGEARQAIQEEVDGVISSRSSDRPFNGDFTLEELDQMESLESSFKETLRITSHGFIVREVMQDFEIDLRIPSRNGTDRYSLKQGEQLVFYPPIHNHNESIFPDPMEFKWDRFAPVDGTKKLPVFKTKRGDVITDPLKSFGGGQHYCAGRKFALNSAKAFVATLFVKYDIEVLGENPGFDRSREGMGVLFPKAEVNITLKER